jgi:hypothetical protein
VGSLFTFSARALLLHIVIPSEITLLADLASVKDRKRWADFCSGERRAIGLIHRIAVRMPSSMLFTVRISLICARSSRFSVSGALKAMTVWILGFTTTSVPMSLRKAKLFSSFCIHSRAASLSISTRTPRFFRIVAERTPFPTSPAVPRILLNSTLSCVPSRWPSFESSPIPSSIICLARIPSLAANFGFACGGG